MPAEASYFICHQALLTSSSLKIGVVMLDGKLEKITGESTHIGKCEVSNCLDCIFWTGFCQ